MLRNGLFIIASDVKINECTVQSSEKLWFLVTLAYLYKVRDIKKQCDNTEYISSQVMIHFLFVAVKKIVQRRINKYFIEK